MPHARLPALLLLAALSGCAAAPNDHHAALPPRATSPTANPATPTTAPATPAVLTAEQFTASLRQLGAPSYIDRQLAVDQLQTAALQNVQRLMKLQKAILTLQDNLTTQLKTLSFSNEEDHETRVRVAGLLDFSSALSAFCSDALQLPPDQQKVVLDWGLSADYCRLVADAYGPRTEQRMEAAQSLKNLAGPGPDYLIRHLINDPSRAVWLSVLDGLYDRPLTPDLLNPLWDAISAQSFRMGQPRAVRTTVVNVHGQSVTINEQETNYTRAQDGPLVARLLIEKDSPLVKSKLNDAFAELIPDVGNNSNPRWRYMMPNYGNAQQTIYPLLEAYHPPAAMKFFAEIMDKGGGNDFNTTMNNQKLFGSMQLDGAAMLLKLAGQDPTDYDLTLTPQFGQRYVIKGTAADAAKILKKIKAWWHDHEAALLANP